MLGTGGELLINSIKHKNTSADKHSCEPHICILWKKNTQRNKQKISKRPFFWSRWKGSKWKKTKGFFVVSKRTAQSVLSLISLNSNIVLGWHFLFHIYVRWGQGSRGRGTFKIQTMTKSSWNPRLCSPRSRPCAGHCHQTNTDGNFRNIPLENFTWCPYW